MKLGLTILLAFIVTVSCAQTKLISDLKAKIATSPHDTITVSLLQDLSFEYLYVDANKSREYAEEALKLSIRINYEFGVGSSYGFLGLSYEVQGDYEKAVELYFQSIEIQERIGFKKGIAANYNNIGLVYGGLNQFQRALKYYKKALYIEYERGIEQDIAVSLISIGMTYKNLGKLDSSLYYYNQAVDLSDAIESDNIRSQLYNHLGGIELQKNDYRSAIPHYKRSVEIDEGGENFYGLATSYNRLSEIYLKLGQEDSALYFARRAMGAAKKISIERTKMAVLQTYAEALRKIDSDSSLIYLHRYMTIKDSLNREQLLERSGELEAIYEKEKRERELEEAKRIEEANKAKGKRDLYEQIIMWVIGAGAIVLIWLLIVWIKRQLKINRKLKLTNEKIREQNEILFQQNKETLSSMKYAKRIQKAVLQSEQDLKKTFNDSFLIFWPKEDITGDFFHAFRNNNHDSILILGDSEVGGIPGALSAVHVVNFISEESDKIESIDEPNELKNFITSSDAEDRPILNQLKLGVYVFDDSSLKMHSENPVYVITEHPPDHGSIMQSANGEFYVVELAGSDKVHKTFSGDIILIMNNGYIVQTGGEGGKSFQKKQLKRLLAGMDKPSLSRVSEMLQTSFVDWKETYEQTDDVLVIGIRI